MKHFYSKFFSKTLKSFTNCWAFLFLTFPIANLGFAQTVISTNHVNNNGNGLVTFNIQNTNVFPIVIRSISNHLGTIATNNVSILYNATPVNDNALPWSLGVVGEGSNGWINGGSSVISNSNTANGVVPVLDALTIVIPANTTYGFALSSTTMQYSSLTNGAGVNTFAAGGVRLLTGDGISWGGTVAPSTPANYPRGFIGSITWYPLSVLKIDLGSIVAKNKANKNEITWNSLSELANDTYELERNIDGRNFVKIASFKANGKASSYKFIDENPSLGDNYYRLKLIEENGDFQYSQIVNATLKSFQGFSVLTYPNPVTEQLFGTLIGKTTGNGNVTLIDINQKEIVKMDVAEHKFAIDVKSLPSGIYILKYADQANTYTQKIIKK